MQSRDESKITLTIIEGFLPVASGAHLAAVPEHREHCFGMLNKAIAHVPERRDDIDAVHYQTGDAVIETNTGGPAHLPWQMCSVITATHMNVHLPTTRDQAAII